MEREYKFEVADMVQAHYLGMAKSWQAWTHDGPGAKFRCHSVYYDTPTEDLAGLGAVVRMRREGERQVMVVKYKTPQKQRVEEGPFFREEWSYEVDSFDDDLPMSAFLDRHGEAIRQCDQSLYNILKCPLQAMYQIDFARQTRLLNVDGSQIEVALDHGVYVFGHRQRPFVELEIELLSGSDVALTKLKDWLCEHFALTPATYSKHDQVRRLAQCL